MRLICLDCGGELSTQFECKTCSKQYPTINDIPSFNDESTYFVHSGFTKDMFEKLLNEVRENGWTETLHGSLEAEHAHLVTNAGGAQRLNIFLSLPLGSRKRALDLGSGWGLHSLGLSQLFEEVYSVDSTLERVLLLKLRANELDIENIYPIHSDVRRLPFSPESFDFLLCNGVLEWVGVNTKQKPPKSLQIDFLKQAFNLLEPGGTLAIGIENRYSYGSLTGGYDHGHTRFTSVVPRKFANILSLKQTGQPYQTYTYSLGEYKTILSEIGFHPHFLIPMPGYNFPLIVCDSSDASIYNSLEIFGKDVPIFSVFRKATKVASTLGLLRRIAPAYYIIAQKPNPDSDSNRALSGSWIGNFLHHHKYDIPLGFTVANPRHNSANSLAIIRYSKHSPVVVRISNFPWLNDFTESAIHFHKMVRDLDYSIKIPRLLDFGNLMDLAYYSQEYINGRSIPLKDSTYSIIVEYIQQLHTSDPLVPGNIRSHLDEVKQRSNEYLPPSIKSLLDDLCLFDSLFEIGDNLLPVAQHGDLVWQNILKSAEGITIIDWERARVDGIPLLDLISLSLSYFAGGMFERRIDTAKKMFFRRTNEIYNKNLENLSRIAGISWNDVHLFEILYFVIQVQYDSEIATRYRKRGFYAPQKRKTMVYSNILHQLSNDAILKHRK